MGAGAGLAVRHLGQVHLVEGAERKVAAVEAQNAKDIFADSFDFETADKAMVDSLQKVETRKSQVKAGAAAAAALAGGVTAMNADTITDAVSGHAELGGGINV